MVVKEQYHCSGRVFGGGEQVKQFRGYTTEKFLASWMYERGNFLCFTGKKLVPPPLTMHQLNNYTNAIQTI